MESADLLPVLGMPAEIVFDPPRPTFGNALQALQIGGMAPVVLWQQIDQGMRQLAARSTGGEPIPGPSTLLIPLQQPRLHQQPQMPRHPRLGLAQDLHEIGNRQFGMGAETQYPEPGRLSGRLQSAQQFIHGPP